MSEAPRQVDLGGLLRRFLVNDNPSRSIDDEDVVAEADRMFVDENPITLRNIFDLMMTATEQETFRKAWIGRFGAEPPPPSSSPSAFELLIRYKPSPYQEENMWRMNAFLERADGSTIAHLIEQRLVQTFPSWSREKIAGELDRLLTSDPLLNPEDEFVDLPTLRFATAGRDVEQLLFPMRKMEEHRLPRSSSFHSNAWTPAAGKREGIAVLPTCDIGTKIEQWRAKFPGGLCRTRGWCCSLNALAFLDVLTHDSAVRRAEEAMYHLADESSMHGSLPLSKLMEWFNAHGEEHNVSYRTREFPIGEKEDLERFYAMLRDELPPDSCTIMFLKRNTLDQCDHYNVVSHDRDGELVVFEPMVGKRYEIGERVSQRYWDGHWAGWYGSIVLVWARIARIDDIGE